jgi:mannose-1-phosphate guanylyltransferase
MAITDAVILAGGFGTRLLPLTERTPKPLLTIGNRPFLETLFARLAQAGVKRVVLSVHHKAAVLRRALPGLRHFSMKLVLRWEPAPLGTGGAIRYAWPDPAKACLVLNGDVLSDFDIRRLQASHAWGKSLATLWAIRVKDTSAFGVMECDPRGRVQRFVEKPMPGQSDSRLANAGLYALEPAVLGFIEPGSSSVERDVFPRLLDQGLDLRVCAAPAGTYWNDIGTPASYLRAQQDLLRRRLWKGRGLALSLWGKPDRRGNLLAASVRIAPGAGVEFSVLGADCRVAEGARLKGCVLHPGCRIGAGASLEGAVLGGKVRVDPGCVVPPGTVLGSGTHVRGATRR